MTGFVMTFTLKRRFKSQMHEQLGYNQKKCELRMHVLNWWKIRLLINYNHHIIWFKYYPSNYTNIRLVVFYLLDTEAAE